MEPYSKRFIVEFVNLLKSLPAIWDSSSREFYNRNEKNRCYHILVEKFQEVESEADIAFVRRKIQVLRRIHNIEFNRIQQGLTSNNWIYKYLRFLSEAEMAANANEYEPQVLKRSRNRQNEAQTHKRPCLATIGSQTHTDDSQKVDADDTELDRFDHMTAAWISNLQCLPQQQQFFAVKLINDILLEADLGNLNTNIPIEVSKYLHTNW